MTDRLLAILSAAMITSQLCEDPEVTIPVAGVPGAFHLLSWERADRLLNALHARAARLERLPVCAGCGRRYSHGCNSDFCSQACEDAYLDSLPPPEPEDAGWVRR
jgi:hypothetical protein